MMFYYPVNKSVFNQVERDKKVDIIDCLDSTELCGDNHQKADPKINKVFIDLNR